MITGDTRDLFIAIATAASALTGLLFVAITVTPRPAHGHPRSVIHQVRSAAALISFTNPLGITLFGLVPTDNAGYASAGFGVVGVLFSLASVRSILTDEAARRRLLSQIWLIFGLLAVCVTEIFYGIVLINHERSTGALASISNVLIVSLLIGIARAWEFVGDRDTGIWSSIAVLATGRNRPMRVLEPEDTESGD